MSQGLISRPTEPSHSCRGAANDESRQSSHTARCDPSHSDLDCIWCRSLDSLNAFFEFACCNGSPTTDDPGGPAPWLGFLMKPAKLNSLRGFFFQVNENALQAIPTDESSCQVWRGRIYREFEPVFRRRELVVA